MQIQTEEHAYCDCGCELKMTGNVLDSHPRLFEHMCEKCPTQVMIDKGYPRLVPSEVTKVIGEISQNSGNSDI